VNFEIGQKYSELGGLYSETGLFDKSISSYQQSIRYYEITQSKTEMMANPCEPSVMANAWHNLGSSYQYSKKVDMAIKCYY